MEHRRLYHFLILIWLCLYTSQAVVASESSLDDDILALLEQYPVGEIVDDIGEFTRREAVVIENPQGFNSTTLKSNEEILDVLRMQHFAQIATSYQILGETSKWMIQRRFNEMISISVNSDAGDQVSVFDRLVAIGITSDRGNASIRKQLANVRYYLGGQQIYFTDRTGKKAQNSSRIDWPLSDRRNLTLSEPIISSVDGLVSSDFVNEEGIFVLLHQDQRVASVRVVGMPPLVILLLMQIGEEAVLFPFEPQNLTTIPIFSGMTLMICPWQGLEKLSAMKFHQSYLEDSDGLVQLIYNSQERYHKDFVPMVAVARIKVFDQQPTLG